MNGITTRRSSLFPVPPNGHGETEPIKSIYYEPTCTHHQQNASWDEDKAKFGPILRALYKRDQQEIFEHPAFDRLPDYPEIAANELEADWEKWAFDYLQHIADNQDLSTILYFIRYQE